MDIELDIENINRKLTDHHFVYVPGETVREWLLHFGATLEDIAVIENGEIHSRMEKDPEPAMHFRQMSVQRNLLVEEEDADHENEIKRRVKDSGVRATQRFYPNEIASSNEDGADVIINREGCRYWPVPPKNYNNSSVTIALSKLMEKFIPTRFTGPDLTNKDSKTIVQDQLLIRINKKTDSFECPTPEGIHQDGTQITSVTLVGSCNLVKGGESRIWPLSTPKGCYTDDQFELETSPFYKKNCLFNLAFRQSWDSVFFNDRLVKHEARPFDGPRPAYRDVILCDLRKPYEDGVDKMMDDDGNIVSIE